MGRLTTCPDCGGKVSKKAKSCPGCGRAMKSRSLIGRLIADGNNVIAAARDLMRGKLDELEQSYRAGTGRA